MPNKSAPITMDAVYTAPGYLFRRMQQIAVAIFMEECRAYDLTPVQFAPWSLTQRFAATPVCVSKTLMQLPLDAVAIILSQNEKQQSRTYSPDTRILCFCSNLTERASPSLARTISYTKTHPVHVPIKSIVLS